MCRSCEEKTARYDPNEFFSAERKEKAQKKPYRVLVVVDAQNDFITGRLGSENARAAVPNIVRKIKEYKRNGWPIVATQDTHWENYSDTHEGKLFPIEHCMHGTRGWEIDDRIEALISDEPHIRKPAFAYIHWKLYYDLFHDAVIEVVGFCTDICVVSNALYLRSAFKENDIVVDSKCCAGTSEEAHNAALLVMKSCQIEVI